MASVRLMADRWWIGPPAGALRTGTASDAGPRTIRSLVLLPTRWLVPARRAPSTNGDATVASSSQPVPTCRSALARSGDGRVFGRVVRARRSVWRGATDFPLAGVASPRCLCRGVGTNVDYGGLAT